MFKKLRNRFLILNMTIITILMVSAFAVIYVITYNNTMSENKSRLDYGGRITEDTVIAGFPISALTITVSDVNEGKDLYTAGTTGVDVSSNTVMIRQATLYDPVSFYVFAGSSGEVISVRSFFDIPEDVYLTASSIALNDQKDFSTITIENKNWMYVISDIIGKSVSSEDIGSASGEQETLYYHMAFLDVTESKRTMLSLLTSFLIVGFVMLFVIYAISYYFSVRAIKPIAEAWDKQKQFVTDASHELKTPLTIINSNMDVLELDTSETIGSQKIWLDYIRHELNRMSKLINDLLYLARAEDIKIDTLPFDLSETVCDAAASMEAVAYEREIVLEQDIEERIIVKGDSEKIMQAVLILLDNAVKYTGENGFISISLKKIKGYARLYVHNSGQPIPRNELVKIFDRFYRVDTSRSQDTGGYGLGLSIAKTIIGRSGGEISASSGNGVNTFTISLKLFSG